MWQRRMWRRYVRVRLSCAEGCSAPVGNGASRPTLPFGASADGRNFACSQWGDALVYAHAAPPLAFRQPTPS